MQSIKILNIIFSPKTPLIIHRIFIIIMYNYRTRTDISWFFLSRARTIVFLCTFKQRNQSTDRDVITLNRRVLTRIMGIYSSKQQPRYTESKNFYRSNISRIQSSTSRVIIRVYFMYRPKSDIVYTALNITCLRALFGLATDNSVHVYVYKIFTVYGNIYTCTLYIM